MHKIKIPHEYPYTIKVVNNVKEIQKNKDKI